MINQENAEQKFKQLITNFKIRSNKVHMNLQLLNPKTSTIEVKKKKIL